MRNGEAWQLGRPVTCTILVAPGRPELPSVLVLLDPGGWGGVSGHCYVLGGALLSPCEAVLCSGWKEQQLLPARGRVGCAGLTVTSKAPSLST